MRGKRADLFAWAAVLSLGLLVGTAPRSFGQEITPNAEVASAGGEGLTLGGWKLYPKIFVGATRDTNIDQQASDAPLPTPTARTSARAVPYLDGFYDGGIYQTQVYSVLDARFFDASNLSATAGLVQGYAPTQDLKFGFSFNYTRQTDLFTNALNFNNGAIGPNISGSPETNIPIIL